MFHVFDRSSTVVILNPRTNQLKTCGHIESPSLTPFRAQSILPNARETQQRCECLPDTQSKFWLFFLSLLNFQCQRVAPVMEMTKRIATHMSMILTMTTIAHGSGIGDARDAPGYNEDGTCDLAWDEVSHDALWCPVVECFACDISGFFVFLCCVRCGVLSSFLLRLRPVVSCITRGRGLTVTFARVLARAHVDGPGFPPTACVSSTSGLSPLARTCSKTWIFLERSHASNIDPKIGVSFTQDMAVFGACCNACVTSRRAKV